MTENAPSKRGIAKLLKTLFLSIAVVVAAIFIYVSPIRQFIRESFMQRVTSAHYEILCSSRALSQDAMTEFAKQREPLFTALDKKLSDAGSNANIRIVFDNEFFRYWPDERGFGTLYSVSGRTIRATLNGKIPQLPPTADAQALLFAVWGKPGNEQFDSWIATWLVGEWRGAEIGMAAATVEQRLGHKRIETLLGNPGGEISSPDDQNLLGAAWITEIAEFGGVGAIRKLYAAKMAHPSAAAVAQALSTTPLELDRKWQLWMYSYLAGMPSMPSGSGMQMKMPMDMPMGGATRMNQ